MKNKAIGVFVALVWVGVFACAQRQPAVPAAVPQSPVDPALVHGILANGFQYFVMRNTTPKERVSAHLIVFTGSAHEEDGERGIAHFLEHMVFNGSEHFRPGELITYFQSIGMDFGGDANARTSFFNTVYDLRLPKGDESHLDDAFRVFQDYAGGALLLESEVAKERGVVLSEKRERDSVSYRTFTKTLSFEMPGSVLTRRFPIGDEAVLNRADRKLIKGYYDRWYRPDNMALVVVGDVDAELAVRLIRERFSKLRDRSGRDGSGQTAAEPSLSFTPHHGVTPFYLYEPEAGKTEIAIERVEYASPEPETVDLLKQRTVRTLGDLMLENRLSRLVSDQKADFSEGSAYSGTYLKSVRIAAIQAECAKENWSGSLAQLENILRQAITYGFTVREFERVRADFLSALDSDVAGAGTRESDRIASSVLGALSGRRLFLSPAQRQELLAPFVAHLDVSAVNAEFRTVWQADHRLVLVTGNADLGNKAIDRIRTVYESASGQAISSYRDTAEKAFPYLTLPAGRARVIDRQENVNGLKISKFTFDNQIRLNLKPTAFERGSFRFKAVFGTGEAGIPQNLYGFSSLVRDAVQESGVGQMDSEELDAALAGKEISLQFDIEATHFALEGKADSREAELLFQLLYTCLADPGFRDSGLNLAKNRYRQTFQAMSRTPDGIMKILGRKFLAGGDERFGLGSPDQADQITLDQIKGWLAPNFAHAPLEISLVGDFDPDTVMKTAATYLGAMGGRQAPRPGKENPSGRILFPKGKKLDLTLDTQFDQEMVRVAFLTDDYWDIMRTRKLSVLARVFSERLREQIREVLGVSYSPYVYSAPSLGFEGYGVMEAVVKTSPGKASLVRETIEKIATDLARDGVTPRETDLAKAPIMTHLTVLQQDNRYWLESVLSDSFWHPERLAWAGHLLTGYGTITADDLSALARKYLSAGNRAEILIQAQ